MIACATSALLVGMSPISHALAADLPTKKGPVPMLVDPSWYTEGEVEVGGRFFLNNPQRDTMPNLGSSLAKYYEYSTLKPGPFSNIWLAAGTRDGKYRFEIFGKNIGYTDQSYGLSVSEAGRHYFDFTYDQTPHIVGYGYSPFAGAGSNFLTVPGAAALNASLLFAAGKTTASTLGTWNTLNAVSSGSQVGILRDTATGEYRWTPNDAWDVKASFQNIHREGSLPDGVVFGWSTAFVSQVQKPVNDDTKNYSLNAEYAGTSPWDKNFTFKLGYNGSQYIDHNKDYFVQNPFCATPATCPVYVSGGVTYLTAPIALMSTPPNNSMNGATSTWAFDLPYKSRYVGTASFTNMQQNDQFLPFTINPNALLPANTVSPAYPASSLNGNINTYLLNNVVTTNITSDVKSKLSYRYYNFDNRTPTLYFPAFVGADTIVVGGATPFTAAGSGYTPLSSVTMSYVKQNAGEELSWRINKAVNVGANYAWEHYDWSKEYVTSTDEHSGKLWADYKPATWFDVRTSALFARKSANNNNPMINLGIYQWILQGATPLSVPGNVWTVPNQVNPSMAGRERVKFDIQANVTVLPGLQITPSFQYTNDNYPLANNAGGLAQIMALNKNFNIPTLWQEGERWSRSMKPGVDFSYALSNDTRLFAFYMFEHASQGFQIGAPGTATLTSSSLMNTMAVTDTIHTFRVGAETTVFDRLNLKASYTFAHQHDSQPIGVAYNGFMNYPDTTVQSNRADFSAKYTFADSWLKSMGLDGKLSAKLAYAFEKNSVSNWAYTDNMIWATALAGLGQTSGAVTFLGYNNPNYTVHRLAASLAYKW